MYAFAGPREYILSRLHIYGPRLSHGRLQRPDGAFECESVALQDLGGDAASVPDNGSQYDGAVDIAPAPAFGCRRCRFQDPHQARGNTHSLDGGSVWRRVLLHQMTDDIALEARGVDLTGG